MRARTLAATLTHARVSHARHPALPQRLRGCVVSRLGLDAVADLKSQHKKSEWLPSSLPPEPTTPVRALFCACSSSPALCPHASRCWCTDAGATFPDAREPALYSRTQCGSRGRSVTRGWVAHALLRLSCCDSCSAGAGWRKCIHRAGRTCRAFSFSLAAHSEYSLLRCMPSVVC